MHGTRLFKRFTERGGRLYECLVEPEIPRRQGKHPFGARLTRVTQ